MILHFTELRGEQVFLCLEHFKVGIRAVVHEFLCAEVSLMKGIDHNAKMLHFLFRLLAGVQVTIHFVARIQQRLLKLQAHFFLFYPSIPVASPQLSLCKDGLHYRCHSHISYHIH